MKEAFEETMDMIEKNLKLCPWIKTQDMKSYSKNIFEEAEEVRIAIENNDSENLKEELGDLLWDILMTAHLAEKEGLFKAKEILNGISSKIKRRKPYLVENKIVSIEDAHRIWAKVKSIEKQLQANKDKNEYEVDRNE